MKVAITVTAVYDFPDDIDIEDIVEKNEFLGRHIVVNGRKFQPIVDFMLDEESEGDEDGELEEIYEYLEDSFVSEDYTIIELDGDDDDVDGDDDDEDDYDDDGDDDDDD
jgi:hypothetical protein